jgi:nucleotide-binding universal stress UspA family protein
VPVDLASTTPSIERLLEEADAYLRAVAATPLFEGLEVLTTVRSGEAPQEIIASAREIGADVIAMTTHGRTGLKRLLFGSVAEAVVRRADVPVFMLRAAHLEAAARVA